MPSTDLLLNYWPGWLSLAIALMLLFNKLVEESYKFASIFGKWGKKLHTRALARHHVNLAAEQFATALNKAVAEERVKWESEGNTAIKALNGRLETVSRITAAQKENIDELAKQNMIQGAYLEYEALWHNKFRVAGARASDGRVSLAELPSHIGYYEFEAQYEQDPKWRDWIDL